VPQQTPKSSRVKMDIYQDRSYSTAVLVLHVLSYFIWILSPVSCGFSLAMAFRGGLKPRCTRTVKLLALGEIFAFVFLAAYCWHIAPYRVCYTDVDYSSSDYPRCRNFGYTCPTREYCYTSYYWDGWISMVVYGASLFLFGIARTVMSQDTEHLEVKATELRAVNSASVHPQQLSGRLVVDSHNHVVVLAPSAPSASAMPPRYNDLHVQQTGAQANVPHMSQGYSAQYAPESTARPHAPQSLPSMESLALELNIGCLLSLAQSGCSTVDLLSRNYAELSSTIGMTQEEYLRLKEFKKRMML